MVTNSIKYFLVAGLVSCGFTAALTSCSDMLETESELVEFEKDHTLNHTTDTVYSSMGIIYKLQTIADRTLLLGEVRGDLITTTDNASNDLKNMAKFDFSKANKYNNLRDYYAVINNCNYFLAHADSGMTRRERKPFRDEYVAVMTFRAWTYFQLGLVYGQAPLILEPVMNDEEIEKAMQVAPTSFEDICKYFIGELEPLMKMTGVNKVKVPTFGTVNNMDSRQFFIPTRALLADMKLWTAKTADDFKQAAELYHDYITDIDDPIKLSADQRISWKNSVKFEESNLSRSYYPMNSDEVLSFIPMETRVFDGVISDLDNLYNSTTENKGYYSLTPSSAMRLLSNSQKYAFEDYSAGGSRPDTVYASDKGLDNPMLIGDLRFFANYSSWSYGTNNEFSEYNSVTQSINKLWNGRIPTYRKTMVYLRYAEALNRAGFPECAVLILKRGICQDNLQNEDYINQTEVARAGNLVTFNKSDFPKYDSNNNLLIRGIHSRGSGDAQVDSIYVVPMPDGALPTLQDSLDYQMPRVEDMIIQEMALEGAFEGYRYYDLMRVALRRNDPTYLADPISLRDGKVDATLKAKLLDKANWYLPLQP